MQALRLVGVTEDGNHLVLTDGGSDFALPIDAALRSALRRDTGHHVLSGHRDDRPMSPVEVQALIRGGADAEEAAERAGWSVDKVHRYEGPILAERQHVARIAAGARLRPKGPASGSPTLLERVTRRLHERGVVMDDVEWDSWRSDDGQWVLELHFEETGRHHRASWIFTKSSMSLRALDHEAERLSDDDPDLFDTISDVEHAPETPADDDAPRFSTSYTSDYSSPVTTSRPHVDADSDLMATLRSTSRAAARRRGPRRHVRDVPTLVESSIEPESLPIPPTAPVDEETMVDPGEMALPAADRSAQPSPEPMPPAPAPEVQAESDLRRDPGLDGTADDLDSDPGSPAAPEPQAARTDDDEVVPQETAAPPVVTEPELHADPTLAGTAADLTADPGAPREPENGPRPVESTDVPSHEEPHLPFEEPAPLPAEPAAAAVPEPEEPEASDVPPTASVTEPAVAEPTDAGASHPAETSEDDETELPRQTAGASAVPLVVEPAGAQADEVPPTPAPRTRTRRRSSAARKTVAPAPQSEQKPEQTSARQDDPAPSPTKLSPNRAVAPAGPPEPAAQPEGEQNRPARKQSAPRKQTSRRKGRASVPAWDDIMFGAKPGEDA